MIETFLTNRVARAFAGLPYHFHLGGVAVWLRRQGSPTERALAVCLSDVYLDGQTEARAVTGALR